MKHIKSVIGTLVLASCSLGPIASAQQGAAPAAPPPLITTSKSTVDLLTKHGFNAVFKDGPGGHTWINWRNYLNEFAPQLFQ